jgi:MFS family permease
VATGVTAALFARFALGQVIDRYGTRALWTVSTLLFAAGCVLMLANDKLTWTIFAARVIYAVGLAGMVTCSMVHIQNHAPPYMRTEIIATLGTSGFVGMIVGTQLGDLMFRMLPAGRPQFLTLFGTAAGLGLVYFLIVLVITRGAAHERPHETPAAHRLFLRYWPGNVMIVATMLGMGFTVSTVFLTRFATEHRLGGIGTFFTFFSGSAFLFRILSRRWSRQYGRHRLILVGLGAQCAGFLLLPLVTRQWHFCLPAMAIGMGHALLFPCVVSLGTGAFPREYRGTGTTIVLGFTEVGAALTAPILGWTIDHYGFTVMFLAAASVCLGIGVMYALTDARRPDFDTGEAPVKTQTRTETAIDFDDDGDRRGPQESISVPFPHVGRNV